MKVVEKDKLIQGMLSEELERCRRVLISLRRELSNLPKGSLHTRQKRYKGKKYLYHYLKYRESGKSMNKHIPESEVEDLIQRLRARKNYEKEIKSYTERIRYLEKISAAR